MNENATPIGVLDLTPPARQPRAQTGLAKAACEIARPLAAAAESAASVHGWLPDTLFAAAWVVALDRLLGEAAVDFHELREAKETNSSIVTSTHRLPLDVGRATWLDQFDKRRREALAAPHDAVPGAAVDQAWWSAGASGTPAPPDIPLILRYGVEPDSKVMAEYSPAAFEASVIDAMLASLARALAGLVDSPGSPLGEIDIVGAAQREQLLSWNRPIRPYDRRLSVDARFRATCAAGPDRIALEWSSGSMSYAELERRSSATAHRLLTSGTVAGTVIGIALDRRPEAIVAILGVLKAGAAYLPLDLKYPAERVAFMLDDAGVTRVIADPEDRHRFPKDAAVLDVTTLCADADGDRSAPPMQRADGDSLAYVMYTSGSTGEPKGIEICHRSIIRLVHDVDYVDLGPDQVMLHAAPLGFDASTLEIWGPLLNGGKCVLYPEAVPTGPGIAQSIEAHGVTTAWLTAALFNAAVDDDPRHFTGLRQLLAGGEALSVPHVRRTLDALPDLALINGYGPTECTTFTATYRVARDLDPDIRSIPLGKPIAETIVHILNGRLEPVPIGIVGELCVGGRGLARGYLHRPELTAKRFVADPSGSSADRLYRTGDMARFLPDGNIEFIGRRDGQVKIRGFRIEVGEIEGALVRHAGIRTCAVIARDDLPGGRRLVGYVVPTGEPVPTADLRAHMSALLPEFMVPSAFVTLSALPVTPNGKLDRRALPKPDNHRPELSQAYLAPADAMEELICRIFADVLGIDRVGRLDNFFELGGSSLLVLQALSRMHQEMQRRFPATLFFNDPTPAAIAAATQATGGTELPASRLARGRRSAAGAGADLPIAIVAMAGRFPGAGNVESFWENLCAGKETITHFRDDQLDPSVPAALRDDPAYVKSRGVIDGLEMFDAAFFGIPPKEAELMDPQQRIFMEICWECLERAGYVPDACPGPVGVFAGMYNATYFQRHVSGYPEKIALLGEFQVMLDNEKDYIATRTANRLNLTGPAVSVHTACSTSLVAIAQAVASLRHGQCDMALAGGASVTCPPNSGYLYQDGAMLSPDGHTRSFDAQAEGTVFSDGAAVVLLKRLDEAIADGDQVFAVIRGAAVNNDGGAKASFTAPSVDGQAAVIVAALADAHVDARSISYVETHGTATPLGDPVEVEALTKAYRRHTPDTGFCRIGSVKSNIGHAVIAAGATGVIKTALALSTELLPASINFKSPNPKLGIEQSPFVVHDRATPWLRGKAPRRAGVSSFGVGGTNAHVILEEAPVAETSGAAVGPQLLLLSGRTPNALAESARRLAEHLEANPGLNLADAAYTLRVGRKPFTERACVVAGSCKEAVTALRDADSANRAAGSVGARLPDTAFMFPGQGAQYAAMGSALYASAPAFRDAFDECALALEGVLDFDLKGRIFSGEAGALTATATTQPALFCVEYALARHWLSLGVRPRAMIGHSVGEFVAATLAGVFPLDAAARLVARRGQLMQALPPGAMLAVRTPLASVLPRLSGRISVAAENSPGLCVVAGPADEIEALRSSLEREDVVSRLLQTSHAFHSAMMDPAVAPFEAEIRKIALSAPSIPIYSTVTARLLTDDEARDPGYWARHLREPVRFSPALQALLEACPGVLLEVGPRATLSTLARQHGSRGRPAPIAIASLADAPDAEAASLLVAAGRLWTTGARIELERLDRRSHKRRILLPTYPFERKRHWVEAKPVSPQIVGQNGKAAEAVAPRPDQPIPVNLQPDSSMNAIATPAGNSPSRLPELVDRVRTILEDISGIEIPGTDTSVPLIELGLDSLSLTQVAIQVKNTFKVNITFRQIMETHRTVDALAAYLDGQLPATVPAASPAASLAAPGPVAAAFPATGAAPTTLIEQVIQQQMQLMAQQIALLRGDSAGSLAMPAVASAPTVPASAATAAVAKSGPEDETATGPGKYDVKKAFGAIARIHTDATEITERQRARLDAFMRRYIARTRLSKAYTQEHRPHMADPRVVNGFRPMLKEIIYQIVVGRSKGAYVWDLDGNQYVDVLNGFGMNMFGWQPDFVLDAVRKQLDLGYEIGPQHPLAGEVAKLVCELTGFDRAGLCNTGSEAVMGAVRIARTVTGRNTIVLFTGSYHGIFDEVIVRATKKLRAVPAAPGIMPSTAQNVLVLDYGTPESMEIIKSRADDIAAVLVEPVQSRRPDFQPREFLQELRKVTADAGTLLILDEVVTGFRCHPGGIQALFGIKADICTYGKVIGGGFPIGVIAGKREYMDALDGGQWQYGDDSIPTVGVTYFAGTFVRHPLALAAGKAVLEHLKQAGPELQVTLTRTTAAMVDELNAFCREVGAPIVLKSFASVWKTFFTEDHPLQDLLFAMMRSRGVHVLDNFPCFFTTAHGNADIAVIKKAFKESVLELQESDFLPRNATFAPAMAVLDASRPPVPGARLGKDRDGKPAWFVPNPDSPGKFLKIDA